MHACKAVEQPYMLLSPCEGKFIEVGQSRCRTGDQGRNGVRLPVRGALKTLFVHSWLIRSHFVSLMRQIQCDPFALLITVSTGTPYLCSSLRSQVKAVSPATN